MLAGAGEGRRSRSRRSLFDLRVRLSHGPYRHHWVGGLDGCEAGSSRRSRRWPAVEAQNLDAVLGALGRGDIEGALSLARDATDVSASIESGIRELGAGGGGAEVMTLPSLRGFLEEMGYSLSNLSELLTDNQQHW